ncbi:MAG: TlpA family protein disulfide reductase [Gammaproteobacteria bacterium]|nr:TlpA family protein disulfide reductase [Gammaproteobacteria bacterium]
MAIQEQSHDIAADFTLQDANDQTHRLSDYKGQWVIVNFWATWCSPCIREIPELNRFYQRHHQAGVNIIGINFEELSVEQLKQAIGEFGISYPVLRIGSVPLVPFEPLRGLPSTFVVSPEGRLVKSWLGPVNEDVLNRYVLPKLNKGKAVNSDSVVRR